MSPTASVPRVDGFPAARGSAILRPMSKATRNFSDARSRRAAGRSAPAAVTPAGTTANDVAPGPAFLPPLKPSRRMFFVGVGLVAVWLATLLALYFITIYPNRSANRTPAAPDAGLPATLPAGAVQR